MALATVICSELNLGAREATGGEQLRLPARALEHRGLSTARNQGLDDARKHRDTKAAGEAHSRSLAVQVEPAPKRTQQVQLVALVASRKPGTAGANDVEDEPDPAAGG